MNTFGQKLLFILASFLLIACGKNNSKDNGSINNNTLVNETTPEGKVDAEKEIKTDGTLVFEWSGDFCSYKGYYPDGLYTKSQLNNTLNLWRKVYYGVNSENTSINNLKNYHNKLDYSNMTKDYENLVAQLKDTNNVVNNSSWRRLFIEHIDYITVQYELLSLRAEAYFDPSVLISNKYMNPDAPCYKYAKALNSSDDTLYEEWENLILELKENNGNPDRVMQEFYNKYNSVDKKKFAYIDLITYGWWNCVNHNFIQHSEYGELENKFKELFTKVEEYDCDEP